MQVLRRNMMSRDKIIMLAWQIANITCRASAKSWIMSRATPSVYFISVAIASKRSPPWVYQVLQMHEKKRAPWWSPAHTPWQGTSRLGSQKLPPTGWCWDGQLLSRWRFRFLSCALSPGIWPATERMHHSMIFEKILSGESRINVKCIHWIPTRELSKKRADMK